MDEEDEAGRKRRHEVWTGWRDPLPEPKTIDEAVKRCSRCRSLVGPGHVEEILVGGVCGSCWREWVRGVPDIPDEEEDRR